MCANCEKLKEMTQTTTILFRAATELTDDRDAKVYASLYMIHDTLANLLRQLGNIDPADLHAQMSLAMIDELEKLLPPQSPQEPLPFSTTYP